jgi:hypothetical protein
MKFICNIRMLLRLAGIRLKPMPSQRKRRLRIVRREQKLKRWAVCEMTKDAELFTCDRTVCPITGLTFDVITMRNKDGTTTKNFSLA